MTVDIVFYITTVKKHRSLISLSTSPITDKLFENQTLSGRIISGTQKFIQYFDTVVDEKLSLFSMQHASFDMPTFYPLLCSAIILQTNLINTPNSAFQDFSLADFELQQCL